MSAEILPEDHRDFHLAFSGGYRLSSRISFVVLLGIGLFIAVPGVLLIFHLIMLVGTGRGGVLLENTQLLVLVLIGLLCVPVALAWLGDLRPILRSLIQVSKSEIDPDALKSGVNLGAAHYVLGADGVTVRMDLHEETYGWSVFTGITETDSLFCLMLGKGRALILPKRVFDDEAARQAFRTTVEANLPVSR